MIKVPITFTFLPIKFLAIINIRKCFPFAYRTANAPACTRSSDECFKNKLNMSYGQ